MFKKKKNKAVSTVNEAVKPQEADEKLHYSLTYEEVKMIYMLLEGVPFQKEIGVKQGAHLYDVILHPENQETLKRYMEMEQKMAQQIAAQRQNIPQQK